MAKSDIDLVRVIGIPILLVILGGIGTMVWEGIEIAKRNETHVEHIREKQKEMRADQKELRSDLNQFMADVSELSTQVKYAGKE